MTIEPAPERPVWVTQSIYACSKAAEGIVEVQETLRGLALRLASHNVDTSSLVEADHDLDHAWQHATSTRRGLRMAWPTKEPD